MYGKTSRAPQPGSAIDTATQALVWAIFSGVVIPTFQLILIRLRSATTPPNGDFIILIGIILLGAVPPLAFLLSIKHHYSMGRGVGAVLYILISISASNFFSAPVLSLSMVFGLGIALAFWYLVQRL